MHYSKFSVAPSQQQRHTQPLPKLVQAQSLPQETDRNVAESVGAGFSASERDLEAYLCKPRLPLACDTYLVKWKVHCRQISWSKFNDLLEHLDERHKISLFCGMLARIIIDSSGNTEPIQPPTCAEGDAIP